MSQNDPIPTSPTPPIADDRPHKPADDKEEVYYEGSPLLRGELGKTVGLSLIGALFIGLAISPWFVNWSMGGWVVITILVVLGLIFFLLPLLLTKTVRYRITNYRIDFERGLLSKKIDTLELWHVEDISFRQSLLDRILGVGTILIESHDETTPNLPLHGLPNPRPLFDSLKQRVIAVKRQRGVIKMDIG